MAQTVVKIVQDDGTEESFGPVELPQNVASQISKVIAPYEQKRLENLEAKRVEQIEREQEARSREAEKANQARIKQASEGGIE